MGILAKTLTEQSSYAAKRTDLWVELFAMIENCVMPDDVDDFERHIMQLGLTVPGSWQESIEEMIEKKREEVAQSNIGLVMRDRFDF